MSVVESIKLVDRGDIGFIEFDLVGEKVRVWLTSQIKGRPSLSYVGSSAVIALCCGIGAMAFMIGL